MLDNKKRDMTPFDMKKPPVKQRFFLVPAIWAACYVMTRKFGLKITKTNMKGIKPPFLVISTHQGYSDYYITPLALFPHRANYVSDMEGFAAFGDWLYRSIGCIGKRRFVTDFSVIKNVRHALKNKQSVVIYPEARHSNAGTTSQLPKNLGKLVKFLNVPLVILSTHGSYLASPFWDEERRRKTKMTAHLECVYTAEELKNTDETEIQRVIEEKLSYDEYKWQYDNKVEITFPGRAEGLHKVLYKCRSCHSEYGMKSEGSTLYCEGCGEKWEMNTYGQLINNNETVHIPDWYEWERSEAEKDVEEKELNYSFSVRVEALPNEKGFVPLGEGILTLDKEAFVLKLGDKEMTFPHRLRESVQTEYNYKERGQCIVLSDKDCCYYIYCDHEDFLPTKLQFIGEYLYSKLNQKKVDV